MVVFAFSIQDQVEKYGAYVGLAAFLGLAVLTVLYFAQARELKRLRDWAGRAPERARELEAQAIANAEAARTPPAPAAERSGTVGPAQPVAPQPAAAPSGNGKAPQIPIGPRPAVAVAAAAARAQGAAVAESPPAADVAVADAEEPAEVAAVAATHGGGPADPPADVTSQETALHDTLGEDDDAPAQPEPQEEPEPDSSGNGVAAEPVIPRATPRPQPAGPPEPAAPAAPLRASEPSRTAPPRRAPVAPARAGDSTRAAKLTGITVGAIVAVAAVVFAATQIFGGDEPTPAPNVTQQPTSSADAGASGGGSSSAAEARPETVVAILNGTPTQGLAKSASDKLIAEGYSDETGMVRTGNNTPDQQLQDSKVLFAPGKRRQARDVASILGITARPEAVDESTLALANGVGGGGDSADVVAVLGLDQAP
jgi:hypothetical protein